MHTTTRYVFCLKPLHVLVAHLLNALPGSVVVWIDALSTWIVSVDESDLRLPQPLLGTTITPGNWQCDACHAAGSGRVMLAGLEVACGS